MRKGNSFLFKPFFSFASMLLLRLNGTVQMEILLYWCGPHDYLAMVSTCKLWSGEQMLRNAACFAVSRMHAPGCESYHTMAQWKSVWEQCVELFHARGWPSVLWKDPCKIQIGALSTVPKKPFFKGLNEMIATQIIHDPVASVLATYIKNVGIRSINACLLLQSGSFAFLGALELEYSIYEETQFCDMCVNVVASSSLEGAQAEAVEFVEVNARRPYFKHPWYMDKKRTLKLYFSFRSCSTSRYVHIEDPFVF